MTPAVDIWSLGCVFSEAAVWSHYGGRRVKEYRRTRSREIKWKTNDSVEGEQIFHWGGRLLDTVEDAHEDMFQGNSASHKIVREILRQVVVGMLHHDGPRPHAKTMFDKAKEIIKRRADIHEITLVRPGGSAECELAGSSNASSKTKSPPQVPPESTLDSSIWPTDQHVSGLPDVKVIPATTITCNDRTLPTPGLSFSERSATNNDRLESETGNQQSSSTGVTGSVSLPRDLPVVKYVPLTPPSPWDPKAREGARKRQRVGYVRSSTLSLKDGLGWIEKQKRLQPSLLPGHTNIGCLYRRDHVSCAFPQGTAFAWVLKSSVFPDGQLRNDVEAQGPC